MSSIVGELARVSGAYEQPTLTLLHQRHAPVIVAIFRSSFGRDVRSIVASRLHQQVDTYLDELRLDGLPNVPVRCGRDLCRDWMRGRWLVRSTDEDGTEMYSLTSHAQDALTLIKGLTRERASLSEHRISTIVSAVRRFNTEANPDRAARVEILDDEISRLTRERDELLAGGPMAQASVDYMLEGYGELLQLLSALPGDFARVEEAFVALRAQILAAFRAEERPAGEVVDEYLAQADSLSTATAEGRAFEGAFTLLRDEALQQQLRDDLSALLNHPLAAEILNDSDRRELRGTVTLIRRRLDEVLAQRKRVSTTLKDFIVTHDITRDREVDLVLRQIESELPAWMSSTGPRTSVPLGLLPPRIVVTHLRERLFDPVTDVAPPPLEQIAGEASAAMTLEELRMQGGPSLGLLAEALEAAINGPEPLPSLGALFDSLPVGLRRPVEIFGLLHLAINRAEVSTHPGNEIYKAIRSDGTTRRLEVPRLVLHHPPEPMGADGPEQPRVGDSRTIDSEPFLKENP